jgi:hypothetical protein
VGAVREAAGEVEEAGGRVEVEDVVVVEVVG